MERVFASGRTPIPKKSNTSAGLRLPSSDNAVAQQSADHLGSPSGLGDLSEVRKILSSQAISSAFKGEKPLFDQDGPGHKLLIELVCAVSTPVLEAFVLSLIQLAESFNGPKLEKSFVAGRDAAAGALREILSKWPSPIDASKDDHPHSGCLPLSEALILSQLSGAARQVLLSIDAAKRSPTASTRPEAQSSSSKSSREPTIRAGTPSQAFMLWAAKEFNIGNSMGLTPFLERRLSLLASKLQRSANGGFTVSSIRNACGGNPYDPDELPSFDPERSLFCAVLKFILANLTQCALFWDDNFPSTDDRELCSSPEVARVAALAAEASRQLAEVGGLVEFFDDLISYFDQEDQGHGRDRGRKAIARAILETTQDAFQRVGTPVRPCNPDLFFHDADSNGMRDLRSIPLEVSKPSTLGKRLETASRFHVERLARGMRIRNSTERKRREREDRDDGRGSTKKTKKAKTSVRARLISKYINDNKAAVSGSGVCWAFNNENGCNLKVANGKCPNGLHSCVVIGCQATHSLWGADDATCPEGAKLNPKLTK